MELPLGHARHEESAGGRGDDVEARREWRARADRGLPAGPESVDRERPDLRLELPGVFGEPRQREGVGGSAGEAREAPRELRSARADLRHARVAVPGLELHVREAVAADHRERGGGRVDGVDGVPRFAEHGARDDGAVLREFDDHGVRGLAADDEQPAVARRMQRADVEVGIAQREVAGRDDCALRGVDGQEADDAAQPGRREMDEAVRGGGERVDARPDVVGQAGGQRVVERDRALGATARIEDVEAQPLRPRELSLRPRADDDAEPAAVGRRDDALRFGLDGGVTDPGGPDGAGQRVEILGGPGVELHGAEQSERGDEGGRAHLHHWQHWQYCVWRSS